MGALTAQATAGKPGDVLVLTDAAVDELVRRGIVEAGSRADLARTAVGVAVRRGAPLPDISTIDALRDTLLTTGSVDISIPHMGERAGSTSRLSCNASGSATP